MTINELLTLSNVLLVLVWCIILPINVIWLIFVTRKNNSMKWENMFPNSPAAREAKREKLERKNKIRKLFGLKEIES